MGSIVDRFTCAAGEHRWGRVKYATGPARRELRWRKCWLCKTGQEQRWDFADARWAPWQELC